MRQQQRDYDNYEPQKISYRDVRAGVAAANASRQLDEVTGQ